MRAYKSSLKLLVAVVALAGLWLGAPHIGKRFFPDTTSQTAAATDKSTHAAVGSPSAQAPQSAQVDQHPKRVHIDPATLPAGTVWTLNDGKSEHTYAIALNELYVPAGPQKQRMHSLPSQPDLNALLATARGLTTQTGTQPQLVLYPLNGPRSESTRRIVTMNVHIETTDLAAVKAASASFGITAWQTPSYAPGHAIGQVSGDPSEPLRVAALLAKLPNVSSAAPLLAKKLTPSALPTDPLFTRQWHLLNTGQQGGTAGVDVNVTPVWPTLKGTGISVAIVDTGLQLNHPDLVANISTTDNHDWIDNDDDPSPDVTLDESGHGTSVAGLVAASSDNNIGVVGVAPAAKLYGLRLIGETVDESAYAAALAWKGEDDLTEIEIQNNSWGPEATYTGLDDPGTLWKDTATNGTATGRGGLGTIYVFSAGNGKDNGAQGNKDGYANNINVIAVSALTNTGASTYYSEGGAHVIVSAPGGEPAPAAGITTTDLTGNDGDNTTATAGGADLSDDNYTKTFAGTSAAAPIVSGVVALMLEANSALSWRDVQEILLRSSTQIQPNDVDWVTRDGGQPGLPLIKQHSYYGGGLINAQAATDLAKTWTPLGTETVLTSSASTAHTIPDGGPAIIIPLDLSSGSVVRVEHVELTINIAHQFRGDLEIKLISPSGVISTLAAPTYSDSDADYSAWTFSSVRHWGESSAGIWKLSIRDAYQSDQGKFISASLKVHGVVIPPPTVTLQPTGAVFAQGSAVSLTCAGTGTGPLSYVWKKDTVVVPGETGAMLNLPAITLAQAGAYTCVLTNFGAGTPTRVANVVVYDPAPLPQIVNPGGTFITPLIAAGPSIDSYQWSLDGSPLVNSAHVSGVTTASLTVTNITSADNGSYTLVAMFNGSPLPTGPITFSMRTPPAVSLPGASFHSRIGSTVTFPLTTDNGPYLYRYIGLPKGLTYNIYTDAVSGRTTAPGTFPVVVLATDPIGLVTTLFVNLIIDPLPATVVGVFNGTVDRDPTLNQNLGGSLTFTTTAGGLLTGKLTQGATTYAFTGALDGAPGADASATLTIPRKGLSSLSLHLDIPLDDSGVVGTLNSTVGVTAWRKAATSSAYAGNYTFALETPAGAGWPAGYSTGTLAVSSAGAVTWTLQPADGTAALKGTTTLSADGNLPLFAPVKTPAGSFLGFFSLPLNSSPASSIIGTVTWLRGSTTSTLYANGAGFGPLTMTLHGGLYSSPTAGTLILGLPGSPNNAMLEFGGTGVDLGAQASSLSAVTLTIAGKNKVVTPAVNPAGLKLTVNAATGAFSGTFTLTDPSLAKPGSSVKRSEKFSGVLLLQDDLGAGFFVLPAIPGSANDTTSGSIIFSQSVP